MRTGARPPGMLPSRLASGAVRASDDQADATLAGRSVANACAPLFEEPSCREGYVLAWDERTSPASRIGVLVDACSAAYCPKLGEPRPALCMHRATQLAPLSEQWQEFQRAALTRDQGAARAERVLAAMKASGEKRKRVLMGP